MYVAFAHALNQLNINAMSICCVGDRQQKLPKTEFLSEKYNSKCNNRNMDKFVFSEAVLCCCFYKRRNKCVCFVLCVCVCFKYEAKAEERNTVSVNIKYTRLSQMVIYISFSF